MKKQYYFIIIALLSSLMLHAQTATDTVKVRLMTSAGAEIGIDGDLSSTNLLTKRVAIGQHKVTVTYGTNYTKDYAIEVTNSEREFDFFIDGQLSVNSVPPGAEVYVDGVSKGKTPVTVPVLGEHRLRVIADADKYYNIEERVKLSPFEQQQRNLTFRKLPPRGCGMVLANYMPVSGSPGFGLTMAYVKRWGFYARTAICGGFFSTGESHRKGGIGFGIYEKNHDYYWGASGGLVYRCHDYVYVYAGGGYGMYSREMQHANGYRYATPYESKGVMLDFGTILRWKYLLAQVGYNRILGEGTPEAFGSVYVGLGASINLQKKGNK